jgi:phenylacetate-CoA ligase
VRRNYSGIFPEGVDTSKYDVSYTSGSTGIPLKILSDQKTRDYSTAVVAYCSKECGLGLRDKIGTFYPPRYTPKIIAIPRPVESGELEITTHRLRRIKPDAIYAKPCVLESICTFDTSGIEPKIIFSHGETLTQQARSQIKLKFNTALNDTYGSIEFNRLAFECNEHTGLHMITDNSVMEFLEDGEPVSPGETGEIVVTGLINHTMPLIRYELGDLGSPTDEVCSCGRNWPLIKNVEGRTEDVFTLKSGRKLYPRFLRMHVKKEFMENPFCISEYQFIQEKRNKIIIRFVKGIKFDEKIITRIKDNIINACMIINENIEVEVQIVKEIPIESSGKKKRVISLIKEFEV